MAGHRVTGAISPQGADASKLLPISHGRSHIAGIALAVATGEVDANGIADQMWSSASSDRDIDGRARPMASTSSTSNWKSSVNGG